MTVGLFVILLIIEGDISLRHLQLSNLPHCHHRDLANVILLTSAVAEEDDRSFRYFQGLVTAKLMA